MKVDDVIYLVAEDPEEHGIFETHTETPRMVYCQVMSVGRSEYWHAKANGLEPTLIFRLSDALEYRGEKIAIFKGKRYAIVRAYTMSEGNAIELTVEEVTVDG